MTWDGKLDAYKTPEQDQQATWKGAAAASSARQDDQQLTELTQLASGHSSKVMELLVNHNLPSGLQAVFQAVADSERYQQDLAAFTLQRQQRAEASQPAQEKEEHERSEQAWLQSMSPEYRQAYGELMATVDNADKQYDSLRERLQAHGKELDAQAQEIDDHALHLSDGSRAYRGDDGQLVDKDNKHLQGQNAVEAAALAQQRGGNVVAHRDYEQNQQAITKTDKLQQKIDADQRKAHQYVKDDTNPKDPNPAKVRRHGNEIKQDKAADRAAIIAEYGPLRNSDTKQLSLAGAFDMESPPSGATHGSFASQVNPNAGIHANSPSASFNAAAQGTGAAPVVASSSPRPTAALAPG